jgi:hypothetical protein
LREREGVEERKSVLGFSTGRRFLSARRVAAARITAQDIADGGDAATQLLRRKEEEDKPIFAENPLKLCLFAPGPLPVKRSTELS